MKSLQSLEIHFIFKAKHNILPELLNENFLFTEKHDIRSKEKEEIDTLYFGSESLSSLAPKKWRLVPDTIKNKKSLSSFKSQK